MSVSNGQIANQTTFNNAFMSRTANDNTTGKKDLQNTDSASGPDVINVQREVNSLDSFTGRAAGTAHNATPTWTNNDVGSSGNNLKARAEALTAAFNATTGHNHDGSTGSGGPISASDLTDLNYFTAQWETTTIASASGTSMDVSTTFTGKTPGGTTSSAGVLTSPTFNRVTIVNQSTETAIEDAQGQRVYGRLEYSSPNWTLYFYTNEAGVETPHSLSSQNIRIYYREVYTLETVPTIGADMGQIPSLDLTADIVDATATIAGKVSTGTQTFGGRKKFNGGVEIKDDSAAFNVEVAMESTTTLTADRKLIVDTKDANITLSGNNSGDVTLAAVGSSPNGNAASLSGQVLNLQPADGTNPGVVTAGTQTIGGNKTFSGTIAASNLSGTNTGDVTLGTFGTTPAAQGASLSGQVLTLQPADGTNPGGISTTTQTFGGNKTFNGSVEMLNAIYFDIAVDSSTTGANQTLSTPSDGHVKVTNASLTSIDGITAPSSKVQLFILTNATGASININDETGTTANRIRTGTGAALALPNNASIILSYDTNSSRWRVIGGSSGGGSFTDPMTTRGDLIYRDSTNSTTRLPIGSANKVLYSDGTDVSWHYLKGTTTNDSAASGDVGEEIKASVVRSSATSLTTNTAKTVTSISLTAGDWDLSIAIGFKMNNTTAYTVLQMGSSLTNNTMPATDTRAVGTSSGEISMEIDAPSTTPGISNADINIAAPTFRVSLSSTTTIYLVAFSTFTTSTMTAYGSIRARRMR